MKKRKFKRMGIILGLVLASLLGTAGAVTYAYIGSAPRLDLNQFVPKEASIILDQKGNPYEELQGKGERENIALGEIPEYVQEAFIVSEDEKFYQHKGVYLGELVGEVLGGKKEQKTSPKSGETITQKLIQLTHLSSGKDRGRRVQEAYLATQLEDMMDKDSILESYLNRIHLGAGQGIQSGAKTYFDKKAQDLTLAQGVVLAAASKGADYSPYGEDELSYSTKNQRAALEILEKMKNQSSINEQQYHEAKKQLHKKDIQLAAPLEPTQYSAFTQGVYEQVVEDLRQQYFGDLPAEQGQQKAKEYINSGGLQIYSTLDSPVQTSIEQHFQEHSQASMMVLDNATGKVKALVGKGEKTIQPEAMTMPLTVYAPAIDSRKLTLATTYDDVPIAIGEWQPENTDQRYAGLTTLREGLGQRKNVVAVQAWQTIGLDISKEYGEKFGLSMVEKAIPHDENPQALATGEYVQGQTPLALVSAFSTFPNQGKRMEPTFYTTVKDATGHVILEKKPKEVEVVSPQTAYLIHDVLRESTQGVSQDEALEELEMVGLSSPASTQGQAWHMGYTPQYTALMWGEELGINTSTLWTRIMEDLPQKGKEKKFPPQPKGIVEVEIDQVSGKLPTALSFKDPRGSQVRTELFIQGTAPTQRDDVHVSIGGRIYLEKPENRFPQGITAINPKEHPENGLGLLVLTPEIRAATGQLDQPQKEPTPEPTEQPVEEPKEQPREQTQEEPKQEPREKKQERPQNPPTARPSQPKPPVQQDKPKPPAQTKPPVQTRPTNPTKPARPTNPPKDHGDLGGDGNPNPSGGGPAGESGGQDKDTGNSQNKEDTATPPFNGESHGDNE